MDSTYQMTASSPERTRSSTPTRAIDASIKPRPKLLTALKRPVTDSSESDSEAGIDASSSEDEATVQSCQIPAAIPKQQLHTEFPGEDENNDGDSDGGGAYERMKKRLAASKASTESQKAPEQAPIMATIESSEDEDEDGIPVRTNARMAITKPTRTASPSASPSSSTRLRQPSPGLFVTPNASPTKTNRGESPGEAGSESNNSPLRSHNASLQERVRRIRAERLAKQEEVKEKELEQMKAKKLRRRLADNNSGSDTDGENGRRLTQQAKPTRKAGKKAMEAMARDQQRISRNMQLAHQAKTKRRYTTKDLFARMGFHNPNDKTSTSSGLPTPDASSNLTSSDTETALVHNTPPTSPPRQDETKIHEAISSAVVAGVERAEDLSPRPMKLDKGKGRAPEFQHLPLHPWMKHAESVTVPNAATETKNCSEDTMVDLSDSEDDLPVEQLKSRFPVFDRLPTKKQHESASLLALRSLAQLVRSPQKTKKGQKLVSLAEMEFSLAQKARQQAQMERAEKIKARGTVDTTEEEREREELEIEDIVARLEKQRERDSKLAAKEKKDAKQNGEAADDLPSDDEWDEDYIGSGDDNADEEQSENETEVEVELSGSEDERDVDEESLADNAHGIADDMAEVEDEREEAAQTKHVEEDVDADMEDDDTDAPVRRRTIGKARNRVIDEDDESDTEAQENASKAQDATQIDAMAAFGFGNANAEAGLTQMFAGTMANMESQSAAADYDAPEQDSLDFLRSLPETQPSAHSSQASDSMVPNSQSLMSPQKESQAGPESQFSLGISQLVGNSPAISRTQLEDFELTQDVGFSFSRSPAGLVPLPSTVDTVIMPTVESPVKQRTGKLQRGRREATVELSDVENDLVETEEGLSADDIQRPPNPNNAISRMKRAAKKQKAIDEFNKKTSMAKDAVMEQAEESEDEYAGLGGASDDDEGEEDQDLKDMIDHNDVKVDERQIAAFYADKSKKEDEKNIAELYKKIQTGGLRRHGGGHDGFDLSDSEDEAEVRRRKNAVRQQRIEARNNSDARLKAWDKNEKKKAFLNALNDFSDDDEADFLNIPADIGVGNEDSQSQEDGIQAMEDDGMQDVIPDSQVTDADSMPAPINPLKRKSPESQKENRPPPHMRRTAAADGLARKPMSFADVQNSVSELLEDSRIIVPDSQFSESEDDDGTPAPNAASRRPVIDRLTLSRTSTMSDAGTDRNMAFHAPSHSTTAPSFRVPSLIRRATSNSSITSEKPSGGSTPVGGSIRRGGTGKSNIHAQAREAERRVLLEKKEGKRKEALKKKLQGGRKRAGGMRSVLGDLGGGFE